MLMQLRAVLSLGPRTADAHASMQTCLHADRTIASARNRVVQLAGKHAAWPSKSRAPRVGQVTTQTTKQSIVETAAPAVEASRGTTATSDYYVDVMPHWARVLDRFDHSSGRDSARASGGDLGKSATRRRGEPGAGQPARRDGSPADVIVAPRTSAPVTVRPPVAVKQRTSSIADSDRGASMQGRLKAAGRCLTPAVARSRRHPPAWWRIRGA